MNIKGKLVEIFDTVQVTETFKKREFIIEDNKNPEYPEYIKVELIQDKEFNYNYDERWFSPIDRTLRRELKSRFGSDGYWFNTTNYKELIDLRVRYKDGYFKFLIPRDRLTSSSARIF